MARGKYTDRNRQLVLQGLKICGKCGEKKPLSAFPDLKSLKGAKGIGGKKTYCKECERSYARAKVQRKTSMRKFIVQNRKLVKRGCKICEKCEQKKPLNDFPLLRSKKGQTGIGGRKAYCKECERSYARERSKIPHIRLKNMWNSYKHADIRKFGNLSRQFIRYKTFLALQHEPCHYCGERVEFMGIDRIDSGKPHTEENCVPCCWRCNQMKRAMGVRNPTAHSDWVFYRLPTYEACGDMAFHKDTVLRDRQVL